MKESDCERAVYRYKPATKDCNFVVYIGVVKKQLGKVCTLQISGNKLL